MRLKRDKEAILDMWAAGLPSSLISARTGVGPEYLRVVVQRARRAGDRRAVPRKRGGDNTVAISPQAKASLAVEAERRGIAETELASLILETIGNENMFSAVLDDQ